jgi:S1-C subfamily serine protease
MIQISATVQPGQSGGAVVNADGEVVGMTTAASGDGGIRFGFEEAAGEAYAIPIGRALDVVDEIRDGESTDRVHVGPRGVLGVSIPTQGRTPTSAGDGVVVGEVDADSGAADAGITAGSTILSVDGVDVVTGDDVTRVMNQLKPDDEIKVTWLDPDGDEHTASIRLVEGPPL